MYFSSQKKKIISLVLVFGCIYAVNACAHPLAGIVQFNISNQAPSIVLGDITIFSDKADANYCKDSSGHLFSIDIPPLGAAGSDAKTISLQYKTIHDVCYADIQYGGNKFTTKVKITSVAATDGGNGAVIKSITRVNGDPLGSDKAFKDWSRSIYNATPNKVSMKVVTSHPVSAYTLSYTQK